MSIRKSYYKDYLSLHKNRKNRRLHFIGQWVTAFHNPIKAKISEWIMFWDILKGKIKI